MIRLEQVMPQESIEVQSAISAEPESLDNGEADLRYLGGIWQRVFISVIILSIMALITYYRLPWLAWTRNQLHRAINATFDETFGVMAKSQSFQELLQKGKAMVRLEEIAKRGSSAEADPLNQKVFQNWSWPVQGSITKRFGWEKESSQGSARFYPGIEITAPANYPVQAAFAGQITKITMEKEGNWALVLTHLNGWKSTYRYLDQVQVQIGQHVTAGETVAHLAKIAGSTESVLGFELTKDDHPVDPLTVLVNY